MDSTAACGAVGCGFKSRRAQGKISTTNGGSKREIKSPKKVENWGSKNKAILDEVVGFANRASKHQIEEIRLKLNEIHAKRFRRRKEPRYGTLNKGFTDIELKHFLNSVPSAKFRLLFKYQAYMGLRVGEVCKLQLGNINFAKRELTILSEKSRKLDSLLIPADLFHETRIFVGSHIREIRNANGYMFFKENDNNHNNVQHIDFHYVRKVFRDVVKHAGLDQIYAYSEESVANHKERPLYRLTTHSLRHYAITRFAKQTNGNIVLACRFARHAKPETTMHYIAKDTEQLYDEIDFAFSSQLRNKLYRGAQNP